MRSWVSSDFLMAVSSLPRRTPAGYERSREVRWRKLCVDSMPYGGGCPSMASRSDLWCSVVIPAYNCAPYIGQTIRSVLEQTVGRHHIEIVAVDDGSNDETAAIIQSFGNEVRFIQLTHGGVSRARNAAIAECNAPYVA